MVKDFLKLCPSPAYPTYFTIVHLLNLYVSWQIFFGKALPSNHSQVRYYVTLLPRSAVIFHKRPKFMQW